MLSASALAIAVALIVLPTPGEPENSTEIPAAPLKPHSSRTRRRSLIASTISRSAARVSSSVMTSSIACGVSSCLPSRCSRP
jgi:hypothetical protein